MLAASSYPVGELGLWESSATWVLLRKEGEKDYSPFMLLPGLVFLFVCLTKPELLKAGQLLHFLEERSLGYRGAKRKPWSFFFEPNTIAASNVKGTPQNIYTKTIPSHKIHDRSLRTMTRNWILDPSTTRDFKHRLLSPDTALNARKRCVRPQSVSTVSALLCIAAIGGLATMCLGGRAVWICLDSGTPRLEV